MTNDEAERIAREYLRGYGSNETACRLCDYILHGSMKREIENATFERAARICENTLGWSEAGDSSVKKAAARIRSLIQPPAQKENGE